MRTLPNVIGIVGLIIALFAVVLSVATFNWGKQGEQGDSPTPKQIQTEVEKYIAAKPSMFSDVLSTHVGFENSNNFDERQLFNGIQMEQGGLLLFTAKQVNNKGVNYHNVKIFTHEKLKEKDIAPIAVISTYLSNKNDSKHKVEYASVLIPVNKGQYVWIQSHEGKDSNVDSNVDITGKLFNISVTD